MKNTHRESRQSRAPVQLEGLSQSSCGEVCIQQKEHSTLALPVHVEVGGGVGQALIKNKVKKFHSILMYAESSWRLNK